MITTTTTRRLRVLIVEDSEADAELIVQLLRRQSFDVVSRRVQTADGMRQALVEHTWDVVLSDYAMPRFSATGAREVLNETGLDIPFIIVSGTIGEETAVSALKAGAHDFLTKNNLSRLARAIEREMADAEERRRRRAVEGLLAETRERMRFALEAAGVGTWERDIVLGKMLWSDVMERLHGMPVGSFTGTFEAFLEAVHPQDRQDLPEQIKVAEWDRTDAELEYRVTWPDGSVRWIAMSGRTFYDEAGQPVRAAGIGMDVTGRKHLEQQLVQSQKMEAIGQLAGGVAHDFNNLLIAILGYTELLAPSFAPETPQHVHLEQIRRSGERATNLTRQLLAFSRRQVLEPRVVDLNALVSDLSKMLRRLIGEDIELQLALADQSLPIKADPGQIEQVIMNLAVNARDAMPRGGCLTVATSSAFIGDEFFARHGIASGAVPREMVCLRVVDTGVGMDASVRSHVFEPFFTTKPRGQGTGLGLATVYGIVKQSGGYVTVSSAPERGAVFEVFLTRAGELPAVEATTAPDRARSLTGDERILIVEDEEAVRSLIREMLEHRGYSVIDAPDAEAAIAAMAGAVEPVDLLVTDVVLPGLNGPELFDRLASLQPGLKAVYMSGYSDELIEKRVAMSPEIAYLQKPFSAVELAQKVREMLDADTAV